ncbi:hypothetical protein DH2020_042285 [Rehmannia glutinosa]|uniref:Non-haem dioxygenase N-terminal domain-containing protein n=1 Tax=Rehmannia glutinosa TaxID=99300 RepID=A0ABR0UP73_REHGL
MESNLPKLGSSLKVPIVQELAKDKLETVPSRYIRLDHDNHHLHSNLSSLPEIPVIDVINHGVDYEVIEIMKLEIKEFFNLPIEEKNKFCQEAGDIEGYGQAFVVSEEQKLDWADLFYIVTLPTHLRKPHLIPKLPAKFR